MGSRVLNNDDYVTSKWSNSYRVKKGKECLQCGLDKIELQCLTDHLISQNKDLQSRFENLYKKDNFDYIFKIIHKEVEKDDKDDKTGTYDCIIKYLEENNKQDIITTLKSVSNIDPLIKDCFELAKGADPLSLFRIIDYIGGNWQTVAETLNVHKVHKDEEYKEKENTFRKWFNYKGFKDGPLELLKACHLHSDVCLVEWEYIQGVLQK